MRLMKAALRFTGRTSLPVSLAFAFALALAGGCASSKPKSSETTQVPADIEQRVLKNPAATTRLKGFARAELKAVTLATASPHRGEDDLARRIDQELRYSLEPLWKKVESVPRSVAFTSPAPGTLLIEPTIVETKLTQQLRREFLTWAEGDTYILFKVTFRDGATGEAVAEPVFYRNANFFYASWSGGVRDREIEREISRDVLAYVRDNY